jgi:hypothetical protein
MSEKDCTASGNWPLSEAQDECHDASSFIFKKRHLMYKTLAAVLTAASASFVFLPAHAADADATLTHSEAKDLKTQSNADYKTNKKIVEATEEQNKADCKTALEGSAKRSCVKSAKAAAKSDEYAAKAAHQLQEKSIDAAKK